MALSPLRPCAEPSCPTLVRKGRCTAHARQLEQQRPNRDVRRWYYTARWKALREQKQRDNPLCVECQAEGRVMVWTDLDHVIPHQGDEALFFNADNVQGLCKPHHSAKTRRGE